LKLGLTSVTFRQWSPECIIQNMKYAGLNTIEWGSDVHLIPGDIENAKKIKDMCDAAEIGISSYGTYYRLGENVEPVKTFSEYLETANAVSAPVVRIWAGDRDADKCDEEYYNRCVRETVLLCDAAAEFNISVATEYHHGTLTCNADSAIRFLNDVNRENFGLYYQFDPNESLNENLISIEKMAPYLKNIHIFNIDCNSNHYFFDEHKGIETWETICNKLKNLNINTAMLFEFIKQSDLEGLCRETKTVKQIMSRCFGDDFR